MMVVLMLIGIIEFCDLIKGSLKLILNGRNLLEVLLKIEFD